MKFFLVFSPDQQRGYGDAPTKMHETRESAKAEAERLAAKSGKEFYVCESIGVAKRKENPVTYIEI